MMAMAVLPIASPIIKRRSVGLGIAWCTREDGCSSKVAKLNAEIMNRPRQTASIKYSGQWCLRAAVMRYWMTAANGRVQVSCSWLVFVRNHEHDHD